MTFTEFVETFWPLLILYASPLLILPVLAFALSRLSGRRYVRRLHKMRRG